MSHSMNITKNIFTLLLCALITTSTHAMLEHSNRPIPRAMDNRESHISMLDNQPMPRQETYREKMTIRTIEAATGIACMTFSLGAFYQTTNTNNYSSDDPENYTVYSKHYLIERASICFMGMMGIELVGKGITRSSLAKKTVPLIKNTLNFLRNLYDHIE